MFWVGICIQIHGETGMVSRFLVLEQGGETFLARFPLGPSMAKQSVRKPSGANGGMVGRIPPQGTLSLASETGLERDPVFPSGTHFLKKPTSVF
jgi:hypothetical protein